MGRSLAFITNIILIANCSVFAGQKSAEPTKVTKPDSADKVTVQSVSGPAQYCDTSGGKTKWLPVKKGDKLSELAVIRTGFGAKVILHFRDDTRVTVMGGTKMGIKQFRDGKTKNTTKTRVGLGYGTIRANVDSSRGPNDFRVEVHNTTLAVTGSNAWINWAGDLGLFFTSFAGDWKTGNQNGVRVVGKGQSSNGKLMPPEILLAMLMDVYMGGNGLSSEEIEFLRRYGSGRGLFLGPGQGGYIRFPHCYYGSRNRSFLTNNISETNR